MSVNLAEIESRIDAFVRLDLDLQTNGSHFGPDTDLFEGGFIDSAGVIELLSFVEREYGVEITEEDLLSDDFTHIAGIARIVARRLPARAGAEQAGA